MKVSLIVTCLFSPALLFAAATHGEAQIPIAEVKRSEPVDFAKDVLPVLRKNCFACHNASEAYAELSLETAEAIRTGGDSGPAVVPGKSGESLLLAVAAHQKKPLMPPPDNDVAAAKLTSQELGLLKLWIDQGADGSGETVLSPSEWRPLPPGIHPIYAVALTRDGQYAACGRANQIYIYHAPSGQLVARLNDPSLQEMSTDKRPGIAHLDMVQSLAFSPEGNRLASGGFRVAKIWRQPTDVQRYQVSLPADVTALATEPDQQIFATGHADGQIFTWNLADGKQAGQFSGHTDRITDLRFAAGGQTLVSSSADQTIRTWDVAEGKLRGRIDSPVAVESLAVTAGKAEEEATPVPELLVTGGGDNYLRKWQLPDQLPETLVDAATNAKAFALSVDQKFLTIGGESGKVTVVDLAGEAEQNEWQAHQSAIHSIAVRQFKSGDQDQIQIATASEDGTVKLSAYPGGETLGVLRATSAPVASVAFHPSAPQLASLDAEGNVRMWNL